MYDRVMAVLTFVAALFVIGLLAGMSVALFRRVFEV